MARGVDGSMMTKEQLDQANLDRFNQAVADGNLYNTGPIGEEGTSFSPERWDDYFKANPTVKPKDYTNQKDMQAKLDSGEGIDTDYQEFVVDEDAIDVRNEEDMPYRTRGADNSFMTAEQAKSEQVVAEQSSLSKEIEADMAMEADIEQDTDTMDDFDTTVEGWTTKFKALSDEDFESAALAIEQLPANAQEAYAQMTEATDDAAFDESVSGQQAEIDALRKEIEADEKDLALSEIDTDIANITYDEEIKAIDDFTTGDKEKRGMLTSNVNELGKGSGDAEADNLARDQAGDMEISDMKDRDITTTIMKDTGLDMDQANALMGKLKGLCG